MPASTRRASGWAGTKSGRRGARVAEAVLRADPVAQLMLLLRGRRSAGCAPANGDPVERHRLACCQPPRRSVRTLLAQCRGGCNGWRAPRRHTGRLGRRRGRREVLKIWDPSDHLLCFWGARWRPAHRHTLPILPANRQSLLHRAPWCRRLSRTALQSRFCHSRGGPPTAGHPVLLWRASASSAAMMDLSAPVRRRAACSSGLVRAPALLQETTLR